MDIATLSTDITPFGVKVTVPKNDLAYLMYYLCCVTRDINLDTLDDDLYDYEHYWRLSNERRALVLQYARQFSPQELIDKVIFRDDGGVFTHTLRNEFCDISVACGFVSVGSDILIAGRVQAVTKVMFYKQSWLNEYYHRPIEHAAAQKRYTSPYFRGITLFFTPLFNLITLFLSTFAYLSPTLMFHDRIALLTVTPSTTPAHPGPVDGLRLFLGLLGSCSKENNTAQAQCTDPKLVPSPVYDLSVLPSSVPKLSIAFSIPQTPLIIAVSLCCASACFLLYILRIFRYTMGKGQTFGSRGMQKWIVFLGVIGFITGLSTFIALRISLGTSVQRFNDAIQDPRYTGPHFVGHVANGFTMLWVAYGFYAVAVSITLYKPSKGTFWRT